MQSRFTSLATLTVASVTIVVLPVFTLPPLDGAGSMSPRSSVPSSTYDSVFNELMALAPLDRGASVSNLVLTRDRAQFDLVNGTLHPLSQVNGRTYGIVFVGEGRFKFTPPRGVEREHLRRLMETDSLDTGFDRLVLLFADSTMEQLERQLAFQATTPSRDAARHVEYALKYLSDEKRRYVRADFLTAVLNDARKGYTYANVRNGGGDPFIVEITPYEAESVRLLRRSQAEDAGEVHELVTQFSSRADANADVAEDARDLVHITHYTGHAWIAKNLDFSAALELRITARQSGLEWVPFSMFSGFEVDSARWNDGSTVEFFWQKENPWLWVRFTPEVQESDARVLTLYYRGDLITGQDDWYYLATSTGWYPHHGNRRRAIFDVTFHYPKRLTLASVGILQSADTSKDMVSSRWLTDRPIRNAGFNVGEFEPLELDYPGVPRTTVLMAKEAHSNLGVTYTDRFGRQQRVQTRYLSGDQMDREVASDVVNSLNFFMQTFGEPLSDRFYATEIPYGHGEAFPGIVHLSWFTFHEERDPGSDQLFRAHEMAHQWWPLGADYKSYRDRWLSEGLAEFSALLYFDAVLMERERYEKRLRDWRDEIMDRGDEAGPIALGHRVATIEHPDDYSLVVYNKGAWVLHMIRSMMADVQTVSDDRFLAMLRDYYEQYRGRRASTADFQAVVEKHIGMSMDWFFEQWIEGTAIPTYEVSHKIEPTADGQFAVTLRVAQHDVPAGFKMVVPVLLEFEGDQWARYQLMVSGPVTEAAMPPFPLEPIRITVNSGEAVLANVRNVDWKD